MLRLATFDVRTSVLSRYMNLIAKLRLPDSARYPLMEIDIDNMALSN